MNVKERLKIYINSLNMTVSEFEKSIFVSNGYINAISKSIGIDKLEKIIELYSNLNIEWLLTGKGEMLKTPGVGLSEVVALTDNERGYLELLKKNLKEKEEQLQDCKKEVASLKKYKGAALDK